MSWRLWRAKGDDSYPWRLQDCDDPSSVIQAGHVAIYCLTETEEADGREGSHPPPYTVLIFGSPTNTERLQRVASFKGAII